MPFTHSPMPRSRNCSRRGLNCPSPGRQRSCSPAGCSALRPFEATPWQERSASARTMNPTNSASRFSSSIPHSFDKALLGNCCASLLGAPPGWFCRSRWLRQTSPPWPCMRVWGSRPIATVRLAAAKCRCSSCEEAEKMPATPGLRCSRRWCKDIAGCLQARLRLRLRSRSRTRTRYQWRSQPGPASGRLRRKVQQHFHRLLAVAGQLEGFTRL